MRKKKCSWYEASESATKGETCADQMTDSFQAHKDVTQFLSQARAMRSALVNRLYCAVCAVFMGVLSTISAFQGFGSSLRQGLSVTTSSFIMLMNMMRYVYVSTLAFDMVVRRRNVLFLKPPATSSLSLLD